MEELRGGAALVNLGAGVPLHRQLFLVLHDEIGRGVLGHGAALPSEQSLCDQFGVSRITVRRALADLADAGLIERRHGVGSFVTGRSPSSRASVGGTYADNLRQIEFETDVEVIECAVRALPPVVGVLWDSRGTALHVLRVRHERRTGEPLMISDAWLPAELTDTVTQSALAEAPLFEILADAGVKLERLEHEMTAEVAGPRTASLLGTAIGVPLIRVNRVAFTTGGPHHVLSIAMSPNRSRVVLNQTSMDEESAVGVSIAHDVRRPI